MMDVLCLNFLYFLTYSILGWLCESIWCSIGERRVVNRGFLSGPLCPIYGVGGMLVVLLLRPFMVNGLLLFLMGMLVTSILEYITGWGLEKIFRLKLWDYSGRIGNINGRVCLRNSLLFGLLAFALAYHIHPRIVSLYSYLPHDWLIGLSFSLLTLLLVDTVSSIRTVLKLNGKLEQLALLLADLREKGDAAFQSVDSRLTELREKQDAAKKDIELRLEDLYRQQNEWLENLKASPFLQRRFLNAFPHARSMTRSDILEQLRQGIKQKK